jgi:hypothetical protein
MLGGMTAAHFSPHLGQPQPCWSCQHFVAMIHGGSAARCGRPGVTPVHAGPGSGCAFHDREPGSDDEPGPPPASPWQATGMLQATQLERPHR